MKITAQEEYGLRCLLQLAQAPGGASLSIADIAAAEGLSQPYVAKLLAVLRQAGLIDSERGRSGGYRLAKLPQDVRLGSVLLALGEPLFEEPGYCQRHAGTETNGACVHLGGCSLRTLWGTLETWMHRTLDQISLADLMRGEEELGDLLRGKLSEVVTEPDVPLIPLRTLSRG